MRSFFNAGMGRALGTFIVTGAVLAGLSFAPEATAATGPGNEIRSIFDQVRDTAKAESGKASNKELEEKLKDILLPVFNFDEMSRRSLGSNWSKATPEQQQEFVNLFSDLLARTYLARVRRNAVTSEIISLKENLQGEKATVRTVVMAEGSEVSIDYKLQKETDRWRIYDVVIENVGLVNNYRTEFGSVVRQQGFPALLQKLREKRDNPTIPKAIEAKVKGDDE